MNDNVNHPSHYTDGPEHSECGRPIEAIDITETHTFNVGNALKYLWRHELKGTPVEDLRKAAWYAGREADRLESLEQDSAVTEAATLPDTHQPHTSTFRAVFGGRFIGTLECSCGYIVDGVSGATRSRLVLELSSVYTEHLRDVWGA